MCRTIFSCHAEDVTERVRPLNDARMRPGKYVLYWSQMNRRVDANHGLAFAAELANQHGLPVLFYEGLTCSYPHANDRLHTFVLEGVAETERRLAKMGIGYVFHLRRRKCDPDDAFYRLAACASAVVTDDYPVFAAREHNRRVPAKVEIPYYAVDSSCIVPMNHFEKREYAAYTIRPKMRRVLDEYLVPPPAIRVNRSYDAPWSPLHTTVTETTVAKLVESCEIDHSVPPSTEFRGGSREARRRLRHFLKNNLRRYASKSNQPAEKATSG